MADAAKPADTPKAEVPAEEPAPAAAKTGAENGTSSITTTIIQAAEHAVVEAGTAVVKEITKKSDGDLKAIEKGLQDELKAETKNGLPSLSEIGTAIVEGVEMVAEEVVEGAEVVVKDVEAHPELIAEGAVALAVGVASLVQPELMAGSVAMIGKMAADHAKQTASDIAVEASSHVVKEISKDITENAGKDAATVEATTTKVAVTNAETKVDGPTGTVVAKELKLTAHETKLVSTGAAAGSSKASEAATDASGDEKDPKTAESTKTENEKAESLAKEGSTAEEKSEAAPSDPAKKDPNPDEEKKGTSVVVSGGDKNVSVKISEDGTITIGTAASSTKEVAEAEAVSDPKPDSEIVKEKSVEKEAANASEENPAPEPEKPSEKVSEEDTEHESKQEPAHSTKPNVKDNEPKTIEKATIAVEKSPPTQVNEALATQNDHESEELTKSADPKLQESEASKDASKKGGVKDDSGIHKSLQEIHQKLDTLVSPKAEISSETKELEVAPGHAQTHESLDQVHQKLNDLVASDSKAKDAAELSSPVATGEKITHDSLEKIHLKLDTLAESHTKEKEAQATANDAAKQTVGPEDLEKIHLKLDSLIASHHESKEAVSANVTSQAATQDDVQKIHLKLDAMQEALAIKAGPASEDKFSPVHKKMDAIHQAILSNSKVHDASVASKEVKEEPLGAGSAVIDALHQKFDTMQTAIDKLTAALAQKLETSVATTELKSNDQGATSQPEEAPSTSCEGEDTNKAPEAITSEPVVINNDGPEDASTVVAAIDGTDTKASEISTPQASTDATSNGDSKPDEATANDKPAASKPATKHVKRSSFFGGIFG